MKVFVALFLSFSLLAGAFIKLYHSEKTEWIMPKELNEISGICFYNEHTLACIQDEKGIIFLYDLEKSEIIQRIAFAKKGDFEGIALVGNTAYAVTGDGVLYEIDNYLTDPEVKLYSLELSNEEESEALCYDKNSNRLLIAFKNQTRDDENPGIYEFDLSSKKLKTEAVIKADFRTSAINKKDRLNTKKLWQPSDIAIDHLKNKLYVLDAINGHMLLLNFSGQVEELVPINGKLLRRPEGIAISKDGSIYICNDANNDGKGKIIKLEN